MKTPHPTAIEFVEAERLLKLDFSDGSQRELPTAFLRGYCPCARCQGHSGGPPRWVPLSSPKSAVVEDVYPVGNYAICIRWGDGHDTGIYAFRHLLDWPVPSDFDPSTLEPGTELDADGL